MLIVAVKIGTKPINPKYFKFPFIKKKRLNNAKPKINLIILSILPTFFIINTP